MYIDDCIVGTQKIFASETEEPLNLGSAELVTVNELVDLVEEFAGIKLLRSYKTDAPVGVRGRNSDNTRIHQQLGWTPSVSLRDGMEKTYAWVFDQVKAELDTK
jgi:nucleoside-diphosphate-sugar epimerase